MPECDHSDGRVVRVSASGRLVPGSIPSRVKPKTFKLVSVTPILGRQFLVSAEGYGCAMVRAANWKYRNQHSNYGLLGVNDHSNRTS